MTKKKQQPKNPIQEFLKEYSVLVEKHKVTFIARPVINQNGTIGTHVVAEQIRLQPVKKETA